MSSGLLSTVAWFILLTVYCIFRAFKIEDPVLGQAFLLLTGAWVGHLTLVLGKKQARIEADAATAKIAAARVEKKVEHLEQAADITEHRAEGDE